MATVTLFYGDQSILDANGHNTSGFSDKWHSKESQLIANGAEFEFNAPAAAIFALVETDGNCRYFVRETTQTAQNRPVEDTDLPLKGDAFALQGPIDVRGAQGCIIKVKAYA